MINDGRTIFQSYKVSPGITQASLLILSAFLFKFVAEKTIKTTIMTTKRWLAAYVKMHHEKKVRDRLASMGIEHFLPVQEEVRQWSDRKKSRASAYR